MDAIDALNHAINFCGPAVAVAVALTLFAVIYERKSQFAGGSIAKFAIVFIVCLATLLAGLWFFGRDGKMATYAAMLVLGASTQWVLNRAWRK